MPNRRNRVVALTGISASPPDVLAAVNGIGKACCSRVRPADRRRPAGGRGRRPRASPRSSSPTAPAAVATGGRGGRARPRRRRALARVTGGRGPPAGLAPRGADAEAGSDPARDGGPASRLRWRRRLSARARRRRARPYVVGGRGYWSHQQVEDVLALLAVIANPLDDEAVLGRACLARLRRRSRTPCGCSQASAQPRASGSASARYIWPTIREVVLGEIPEDRRREGGRRAVRGRAAAPRRAVRGDRGLRERSPLLGLQGTIEAMTRGAGLRPRDPDARPRRGALGERPQADRLAGEYEATRARTSGLRDSAADETERAGEGEAPIAAEEHDGVRIMTVHAAKGLEFELVAVPELGRRLAGWIPLDPDRRREPAPEGEDDPERPRRSASASGSPASGGPRRRCSSSTS